MSDHSDLNDFIDSTLSLLEPYAVAAGANSSDEEPLLSLFSQCELQCTALEYAPREPVRTIHHFACSGGTIMSRAVASQPNTVLLSEIDPLSKIGTDIANFAPSDVIGSARAGIRGAPNEIIEDTFVTTLDALHKKLSLIGRYLVLRDHAHSHFCYEADPESRPSLRDMIIDKFNIRSIVTVRHPLDSYLSLVKMGWTHFQPATLEEYSRRYQLFLSEYVTLEVFRYENFTADPDGVMENISSALALPYNPNWRDLIPLFVLSGDSGRKSDVISSRQRRNVSEEIETQSFHSPTYEAICDQLGYNPDPSADPLL